MIYFTSDLHFGHNNMIRHTGRPFENAEEMDLILIQKWNQTVSSRDEVYILGDFTMKGAAYACEILGQLRGRKYLIRGNHDRFADDPGFNRALFEWIRDYYELKWQNQRWILFHYPIEEWNGYFKGSIDLHGHQHNHEEYNLTNLERRIRRYDVGVDANGMKPVSIAEIADFFSGI